MGLREFSILPSLVSLLVASCTCNHAQDHATDVLPERAPPSEVQAPPDVIQIVGIAQNPEGIEYNRNSHTFLLSSLNASPILSVRLDGTWEPFTSGEAFPLSSAGIQIDYPNNRLLVAGFNGIEALDEDPETKGVSRLRVYDLETGVIERDVELSSLVPGADVYFANDVAVDSEGNVYVSDWFAGVIYKVDIAGTSSLFWENDHLSENDTAVLAQPNGLDFHPGGYLLVSLVAVNDEGLYSDHGLVKIPIDDPSSSSNVDVSGSGFSGFDGMVVVTGGNIVGVTNDGISPGGNLLIELSSDDDWGTAEVIRSNSITPSTTVAVTPEGQNYVINQDFSNDSSETWTIERVAL